MAVLFTMDQNWICFLCDQVIEVFNYADHLLFMHSVKEENIKKVMMLTNQHNLSQLNNRTTITSHCQQNDEYFNDISNAGINLETSFESIERITEEVRKFQNLSNEVDRQLEGTETLECPSAPKVDLDQVHLKTPDNIQETGNIVEIVDLENLPSPKGAKSLLKTESIFSCAMCSKNFSSTSRGKHLRRVHKIKFSDYLKLHGQTTRYKNYSCLICGEHVDWTIPTISKHLKNKHNTNLPQYELQYKDAILEQKKKMNTVFLCHLCPRSFETIDLMDDHKTRVHHLQKSLESCQKASESSTSKKKQKFIWQKRRPNCTRIKQSDGGNSRMSETLEKFSCTKKVEVALNLLEPAYVVEKVQELHEANDQFIDELLDSPDENSNESHGGRADKTRDIDINDIVDGSHANSESNEAWDYSGLSKLDLGKLINNAISENFSELKDNVICDEDNTYNFSLKCWICSFTSEDKTVLKSHIQDMHTKILPITCCDNIFLTKYDEQLHIQNHHPNDKINDNDSIINIINTKNKNQYSKVKTSKHKGQENPKRSGSSSCCKEIEIYTTPAKIIRNETWIVSPKFVQKQVVNDEYPKQTANYETIEIDDDTPPRQQSGGDTSTDEMTSCSSNEWLSSELETSVDDIDAESGEMDVTEYKSWANKCWISCEYELCGYKTQNLINFRMHTLSSHDILIEEYMKKFKSECSLWSESVYTKCCLCGQQVLHTQEKLDEHMFSSHDISGFKYFKLYIKPTLDIQDSDETIRYKKAIPSLRSTRSPSI